MPEVTLTTFLIVCPMVFLAGFVDAVAGGGGLISLPAYLVTGLPVHAAMATNKLSSATGTLFSTARLVKNGYADLKLALPSVAAALIGSALGANIALHTSEQVLRMILVVLLPLVALYVLLHKNLEPKRPFSLSRPVTCLIVVLCSFGVGLYDGFYGPGTGTFAILLFTTLARLDLRTASGNTKIVNLSSNMAALFTFVLAGQVIWALGLAASVFSIAGHWVGSGFVMKDGTRIVRPLMLLVLALLLVRIVWDMVG